MAQTLFTVDVPDAANLATQRTRVVAAFATVYNWQAFVVNPADPGGPLIANPESKAQFAKRQVVAFVRDVVKQAEAITATEAARLAAVEKVDQEVVLS